MKQRLRAVNTERSVLEAARDRVNHIFDHYDHVCVSFSGGKDSTVCLELTLEEAERRGRLPLDVVFYDEEAIPYETEHYVRRRYNDPRINMRWLCLPVQHTNACSREEPYWYPWDPRIPEKWVRPLPPEGITFLDGFQFQVDSIPSLNDRLINTGKSGSTALVLGIRASESLTRHDAVTRKQGENWIIHNIAVGISKVYPIYDWKTSDVWHAPHIFGWDYNTSYDVMELAGIRHDQQRCAPPYGNEPLENLWMFRECFPDIWDKMQSRVTGSATAARYSNTELYGYGSKPEKPADVTWPEYLRSLIEHWTDDKVRQGIADRIRLEVSKHYRKTNDPIVGIAPHPITGMSWQFLQGLALRGDFKGRKRALARVGSSAARGEMDKLWTAYNAERATFKEDHGSRY